MTDNLPAVPIQSIERAAQVLGLFADGRADLDLADITRQLGLSRATAHRYCMSLRAVGLLRYEPNSGHYGLGTRVIQLGAAALDGLHILEVARPHVRQLVARIDRTTVMTIWDGQAPVVVMVNDHSSALVRISVRIGARLPLFESAQGRIYLAFSNAMRRRFERMPEWAAASADLALVRERGVSIRASVTEGIRAIAAPVRHNDEVAGTLAIIGTLTMVPDDPDNPMVDELRQAARGLSEALSELERP